MGAALRCVCGAVAGGVGCACLPVRPSVRPSASVMWHEQALPERCGEVGAGGAGAGASVSGLCAAVRGVQPFCGARRSSRVPDAALW